MKEEVEAAKAYARKF